MIAHVSAIIPVYNGERYLAEAIESVLAQTHPASEIIVVDDGSTDRSGEVARSFGVRYLRKANAGQASALNVGIAAAKSSLLAFLDADDRWLPSKLALQLDALVATPELELVFGHARQFVEHRVGFPSDAERQVLPSRLPSAMLLRRAAWERVGPFENEWALGAVIEWCARADDLGTKSVMLDAVLYERRLHGKNSSLTHRAPAREYARMLKDVLDRRRARASSPTKGGTS